MRKSMIFFIGILIIISLSACGKVAENVGVKESLVRTYTVKDSEISQQANYSGEVRGRYEEKLAFQVGGKILSRQVEVGSQVKAGDVLLTIDSKDIKQNLNINSAQVEAAQSKLDLATTDLQRYSSLYEQGAISSSMLDKYKNAHEVALAAMRESNAQYSQGANQLDYSYLRADNEGVITGIEVEAGQVVGAGQTIITLVRAGEREIEINVPENRIEQLRKNVDVKVEFWALSNLNVAGKVREISPIADKITRTYRVRISLLEPTDAIKLGMTANVLMNYKDQQHPVCVIPLTAIFQTGDTPNVWLVREGTVQLQVVKLGNFAGDTIEVLEGLKSGDVIVTAGVQKLKAGQKVRL